jgi:hypothetical protein
VKLTITKPITLYRVLQSGKLPPDCEPDYKIEIPPETYELSQIPSPIGKKSVPWVVTTFEGERIGMALETLRSEAEHSDGAISIC